VVSLLAADLPRTEAHPKRLQRVLLISTYELGHQPFGLAEPIAWLRRAGHDVRALDLAVERLDEQAVRDADLVAVYLPMHTATRLAARLIPRVRQTNPTAHLAAYGLYAPLQASYLRGLGVNTILGGEFEEGLTMLAAGGRPPSTVSLARLAFLPPDRSDLPALDRYGHVRMPDGERRIAGYVEATRGCKHTCRHCPIPAVYGGRFRVVPREVVLEDVRRQVAAGAMHITFGDPDFLNGPGHALPIVRALHSEFPDLTYDAVIKVEHLLRHLDLLPELRDSGCLWVTTAVEAVDDTVLRILRKGHTRADFERVVELCRDVGLTLAPTFVAFTPWTSVHGYLDLLAAIADLDLVEAVPSIQLAIRLLIPPGSLLLELAEVQELVGPLDEAALVHPWSNPHPGADALQAEVQRLVQRGAEMSRRAVFESVWLASHAAAQRPAPALPTGSGGGPPPHLSEAWYCCAEPSDEQGVGV